MVNVDAIPGATFLLASNGLTTLKYSESSSITFTSRGTCNSQEHVHVKPVIITNENEQDHHLHV